MVVHFFEKKARILILFMVFGFILTEWVLLCLSAKVTFTRWEIPLDQVKRIPYALEPTALLPREDELKGGSITTRWKRLQEHAAGHGEVSLRYGWTIL